MLPSCFTMASCRSLPPTTYAQSPCADRNLVGYAGTLSKRNALSDLPPAPKHPLLAILSPESCGSSSVCKSRHDRLVYVLILLVRSKNWPFATVY